MRVDLAGRACPLSRAVSEIGDGWTMLILWACFNDVNRFDEIQTRFGVARNILADRLKKLVDRGLLTRQPIMDGAKRCIYVPTQRAEPLRAPLAALSASYGSGFALQGLSPLQALGVVAVAALLGWLGAGVVTGHFLGQTRAD